MPGSRAYSFGAFTLRREDRSLRLRDIPVPLGENAMELLFALVENNAQVLTKAALMKRVWPDASVDESTLRFHIANLRKALGHTAHGQRYIVNVAGRGYCFVAPIERFAPDGSAVTPAWRYPSRPVRLLGRERALEDLEAMLSRHRFVSVVGAGGMGKSSLAFTAADRLGGCYPDGIFLLDIALISDAAMVATTLAHQVGVVYAPGEALAAVCRWFQGRRALVILDSCETQIDACAALAKAVLEQAAHAHVLATTREALRVKGEWVLQLKPLATPAPPWDGHTRASVLASPAVQLVVARLRALNPAFELSDEELPHVCELVCRLDGMPLAIELASVRLDGMGLRELLQELDTRAFLRSACDGRGINRHQTIEALLDWSYERLEDDERRVLRRLSVCNGAFSLETAQAVAADHTLSEAAVVDAVFGLEMKSLLSVETYPHDVRYRLLDSTRAYAAERLGEGDEYRLVRVQQCVHLHDTMLRAEADAPRMAVTEWSGLYGPANNDMRASIAWGFGPQGDVVRAIRLVAASIAFAHHLALAEEYGVHMRRALDCLPQLPKPEPEVEIALLNGLFVLHMLSRGPGHRPWETHARIQALAERLDSRRHRMEALNGMFVQAYFGQGDYPAAQGFADAVAALAEDDPAPSHLVQRLHLQSLHGLGRHEEARQGLEALLRHPPPRQRPRPPFPIDMAVMARMMLVRIDWLQGRADDAVGLLADLQSLAARDVRFALANAYAWSICPLFLWCRDLARARRAIDDMHRHASEIDMPFTASWACAFDLAWSRLAGQPTVLPDAQALGRRASATGVVDELLGTFHAALVSPGLSARRRQGSLGWCAPEILRAEGERLLADAASPADEALAQQHFQAALQQAAAQGALAWQLRAATSLARLRLRQDRPAAARAVLEPVVAQFHQGLWTADLREAVALLATQSV